MKIPKNVRLKIPDGELIDQLRKAEPSTQLYHVYVYLDAKPEVYNPDYKEGSPNGPNTGAFNSIEWAIQDLDLKYNVRGRPTKEREMYAHPTDMKAARYFWAVNGSAENIMKLLERPQINFAGTQQDVFSAHDRLKAQLA